MLTCYYIDLIISQHHKGLGKMTCGVFDDFRNKNIGIFWRNSYINDEHSFCKWDDMSKSIACRIACVNYTLKCSTFIWKRPIIRSCATRGSAKLEYMWWYYRFKCSAYSDTEPEFSGGTCTYLSNYPLIGLIKRRAKNEPSKCNEIITRDAVDSMYSGPYNGDDWFTDINYSIWWRVHASVPHLFVSYTVIFGNIFRLDPIETFKWFTLIYCSSSQIPF